MYFMYPNINPIAFHVATWPVHWYGLMYLVGFLAAWVLLSIRITTVNRDFNREQVSDLVFFAALGAIVGGRLGYILFYDWHVLFTNPLLVVQTWKGGMSFHGGLLGVLVALCYCTRKMQKTFLQLTDFIAPVVPIGLGAGRIGNFINGELWGRPTTAAWGMIYPHVDALPRHPSQLYEFALEGVMLFIIMWVFSARPKPRGAVSGLFALCYGLLRITAEFFREPDQQIGYIAFGWLTEGQLLSLPLVIVGILLLSYAYYGQSKR